MIHARSILALAADVLLGLRPSPRCTTPRCTYRARGERDLARHIARCPWRVGGPS